MIYIIGDSHSESFNIPIISFNLMAPTAYQNIKRIHQVNDILKVVGVDKTNDYLFFSFGEIDIRCHLGFISEKFNRTYEDVINECVERYRVFLNYYKTEGYKVGVWAPIPSGKYDGVQGNGVKSWRSYKERNELTSIFNTYLQNVCRYENFIYKSVFEIITNDVENYDDYYSIDGIHLNSSRFKTKENHINCSQFMLSQFNDIL